MTGEPGGVTDYQLWKGRHTLAPCKKTVIVLPNAGNAPGDR